jgi:hypothetical protein
MIFASAGSHTPSLTHASFSHVTSKWEPDTITAHCDSAGDLMWSIAVTIREFGWNRMRRLKARSDFLVHKDPGNLLFLEPLFSPAL